MKKYFYQSKKMYSFKNLHPRNEKRWCRYHRTKTHENAECIAQKKQTKNNETIQ